VRKSIAVHISFFLIVLFSGSVWQSAVVFDFLINQEKIITEKCVNKENSEVHCNGACYLNKQLTIVELSVPVESNASTVILDFWLLSYLDKYQVNSTIAVKTNLQVIDNSKINLDSGQLSDVFHPPQLV